MALQRRHLGRTPSVILVVLLAAMMLSGVVWLVTVEVAGLAGDLPTYTENIKEKVRSLRRMGQGSAIERLQKMIEDVTGEWESPPASADRETVHQPAAEANSSVVMKAEVTAWLDTLWGWLSVLVGS